MTKLILKFLLFLSSMHLMGQGSISYNVKHTPFGIAPANRIHHISPNQYVINEEGYILIREVISNSPVKSLQLSESNNKNNALTNGWTTYARGQIFDIYPSKPTFFETTYVVPQAPSDHNQLIYVFNGLGNIISGVSHIMQPVLQWGRSPAGGGDYWGICNWYVNNNQFFHDSLIRVNPGDTLKALIELTSTLDGKNNYRASFIGVSNGLEVRNLPELENLYIALETYNADCNDLPKDEKIKFSNIRVKTKIANPTILWHKMDYNTCGQYTTIVNQSSEGGEVHINFHTPLSINDFDEIHFYPNPVRDLLHISPNGIKSVLGNRKEIKDCTIQIYHTNGRLMFSDFYPSLNSEFNLDLRNLIPGIYLITFSYADTSHTFKLIKV